MMYFCRYRNSAITGIAASTAPAEKMVQLREVSCATNWYSPTASVCVCGSVSTIEAITNSLEVAMNDSRPTTARMGATRRRMIVKKMRACLAPSILAASSMDTGTVLKNPYMR